MEPNIVSAFRMVVSEVDDVNRRRNEHHARAYMQNKLRFPMLMVEWRRNRVVRTVRTNRSVEEFKEKLRGQDFLVTRTWNSGSVNKVELYQPATIPEAIKCICVLTFSHTGDVLREMEVEVEVFGASAEGVEATVDQVVAMA